MSQRFSDIKVMVIIKRIILCHLSIIMAT